MADAVHCLIRGGDSQRSTKSRQFMLWCPDLPEGLGEQLRYGHRPGDGAGEALGLFLIVTQDGDELLHLGWGRPEAARAREPTRAVLPRSIAVHSWQAPLQVELSAKPGVKSPDEQFSIAEGIGDALCRDRVFMIASIAHQRPAGA